MDIIAVHIISMNTKQVFFYISVGPLVYLYEILVSIHSFLSDIRHCSGISW